MKAQLHFEISQKTEIYDNIRNERATIQKKNSKYSNGRNTNKWMNILTDEAIVGVFMKEVFWWLISKYLKSNCTGEQFF